jgi:hypothetical protein
MDDHKLKINPPLYMIGRKISCWRCGSRMSVIALLAPKVDDTEDQVCVLSGIENIPEKILSFIQSKVPTFVLKLSKTIGSKYFANTCPKCRVIYGDFFLHEEPGAPLFPSDEKEATSLYIKEIPLSEPIEIGAGVGIGLGEMILKNAKKV